MPLNTRATPKRPVTAPGRGRMNGSRQSRGVSCARRRTSSTCSRSTPIRSASDSGGCTRSGAAWSRSRGARRRPTGSDASTVSLAPSVRTMVTRTVRVTIVRTDGASDTVVASLPVGRRRAPRERLHAAPDLVQPPESLAERIGAEREQVEEVRRRAHDTPRLWREPFMRPRPGAVTGRFGVARVFNGMLRSRHLGVDFAGRPGAAVRAANRGVVALVADLYLSGTTILIDHGAGLVTGYFHLSRALVSVGDTVGRGQLIGHVGASGRVTGPHLHWLAAYGILTVDPLGLVNLDFDAPLTFGIR